MRNTTFSKLRAMLVVGVLALLAVNVVSAQNAPQGGKTDPNRLAQAAAQGSVSVIVGLDVDTFSGKGFSTLSEIDQTFYITGAQNTLIANLAAAGVNPRNVENFEFIPFMAMTVDAAGLKALQNSPLVNYIQEDGFNFVSDLDLSTTQIGANGAGGAWEMGYDGDGQVVAVLDTGVDKNHSFLSGKVVSEACYGTNDTRVYSDVGTVIFDSLCPDDAEKSTVADSGLPCDADFEGCYHGTHVAGIVAGTSSSFSGVAKGSSIIAVQVFSSLENTIVCGSSTPCISAMDRDIIRGLSQVYKLRNEFNIASVNMSLGGSYGYNNQIECDSDNLATRSITDKLYLAKIAVVASAGNSGQKNGIASPACISRVIAVGSVDNDGETPSDFSQSGNLIDLMAPGATIYSSMPGGDFENLSGTSMAAPHVAGAWAVVKSKFGSASVNKVFKAFKKTGIKIQEQGRKVPMIQVDEALKYLTVPSAPVLTAPAQNERVTTTPVTFTWTEATDATEYKLKIKRSVNGKTAFNEVVSATCSAGSCSYTYDVPFAKNGDYKWTVTARNEYNATVSAKGKFKVKYPAPLR